MGQSPQRNLHVTDFLVGLVEKPLCPSQWRHTAFCENPQVLSLLFCSCLCFSCPYTSEVERYIIVHVTAGENNNKTPQPQNYCLTLQHTQVSPILLK